MCIDRHIRTALALCIAALTLAFASPLGALELCVAGWNLEHLDDRNGAGFAFGEPVDVGGLQIGVKRLKFPLGSPLGDMSAHHFGPRWVPLSRLTTFADSPRAACSPTSAPTA